MTARPGFSAALSRELKYYRRHGREFLFSVAILLLSMASVNWIFSSGTIRNLPVAIIDQDGSSTSRAYVRMLEATPEINVYRHLNSPNQARELLEQATVYAVVLIPRDFSRDLKSGRQVTVVAWHSGQFLTISGVLSKSLTTVTGTFSAGVEMTSLARRGDSRLASEINFEPIRAELRTLFNPFQNYQYFLVSGLLPAMLQVFVMVWSVFVIGREFRDHTSDDWIASGRTVYAAIAAKLLPLFIVASVIGFGCLGWVHGYSGWPVAGNFHMLLLGWEIMICAYLVLGALVVGFVPQFATALSLTAAFTAPAFAYAGVTFPQQAMPLVAQIWTYALPVRTLLRLQVEQAQIGAPLSSSIPELMVLIAFVLLPLPIVFRQIRRRCETVASRGQ